MADDELRDWISLLASGNDDERRFCAAHLASLGTAAAPAATGLIRALGDVCPAVQYHAAWALAQMDPEDVASAFEPGCFVYVLFAQGARDEVTRGVAEFLLMRIMPLGPAARKAAAGALDDDLIRRMICELPRVGARDRELFRGLFTETASLPVALAVLRQERDPQVRASAVAVLGCHPPTRQIIKALSDLCSEAGWDGFKPEYIEAARVLAKAGRLGVRFVEEFVCIAIGDETNPEVSDAFVRAILALGPGARRQVRKLLGQPLGRVDYSAHARLEAGPYSTETE